MSIIQTPCYKMYWKTGTRYGLTCNIMNQERFELINRYVHFNNSNKDIRKQDENRDRLFKIGPLFEAMRQNCLSQNLKKLKSIVGMIDEQMIPLEEEFLYVVYMPNKLRKWGFKLYT